MQTFICFCAYFYILQEYKSKVEYIINLEILGETWFYGQHLSTKKRVRGDP